MSEVKSKLYPEIDRTEIVTETELNAMIAKKINNQNLEIIKTKYRELSLKLTHYDKIRRRYAKLSNAVRVAGIAIATGFGVASIVTGSLLLPPVIPIVLGSASLLQGVISEGALRTYFKHRKHYFAKKCDTIRKYLNRIFVFEAKASEDQVVTASELEQFRDLIDSFDNEMNGVKEDAIDKSTLDLSALRQEAMSEAKKLIATEMKQKLVEEAKAKLRSSVAS
jgi:hypothetical protein